MMINISEIWTLILLLTNLTIQTQIGREMMHLEMQMNHKFGEEMKLLPPLLFLLGYFLIGWAVIWILVMVLSRGDPKFAGKVGFHYGIWICAYLPIAISGTIALARLKGDYRKNIIVVIISLMAVLVVMFISFFFNHWAVLLVEYFSFAIGFWFLVRTTNKHIERSEKRS